MKGPQTDIYDRPQEPQEGQAQPGELDRSKAMCHKRPLMMEEQTIRGCLNCGVSIEHMRSQAKHCSPKCRKNASQNRCRTVQNSEESPTKRRENLELVDTSLWLSERYYQTPPLEREGYLEDLIGYAKTNARYRNLLTNQYLMNSEDEKHHTHGSPKSYNTIQKEANLYCQKKWGQPINSVLPPRGHLPSETVVTR